MIAHYQSRLDFTQDALHAAASGLRRLRRAAGDGTDEAEIDLSAEPMAGYRARFVEAISEDLGTPAAPAVAHVVAGADDLDPAQRRALLLDFDRVLGLSLDVSAEADAVELLDGAAELLAERTTARAARDFATSDRLRDEVAAMGVEVRDAADDQTTVGR